MTFAWINRKKDVGLDIWAVKMYWTSSVVPIFPLAAKGFFCRLLVTDPVQYISQVVTACAEQASEMLPPWFFFP